ncbi:hypothetical protein BKA70DRAFT_1479271 [Coprinopsis sp. MPI-PUGE-AT-0042]|nr:hypothetical protein BKA70DRAFT_1479271 [Coprinopsis sp. MPI-PUGE-AT-0042]
MQWGEADFLPDDDDHRFWRDAKSLKEGGKTDSTKSTQTFCQLRRTADLSMERAAIQPAMQRTGLPGSKSHTRFDNASIFDHWSITDWHVSILYKQSRRVFQMVLTGYFNVNQPPWPVSIVDYLEAHPLHPTQPLPIRAAETYRSSLPPSLPCDEPKRDMRMRPPAHPNSALEYAEEDEKMETKADLQSGTTDTIQIRKQVTMKHDPPLTTTNRLPLAIINMFLPVNPSPSYASGILGFTPPWLCQGPDHVQSLAFLKGCGTIPPKGRMLGSHRSDEQGVDDGQVIPLRTLCALSILPACDDESRQPLAFNKSDIVLGSLEACSCPRSSLRAIPDDESQGGGGEGTHGRIRG